MKPTTRLLTAVLLTSMMMLSGCLGTGGDEEGGGLVPKGSTTTVVNGNYLPIVNAYQIGPLSENITYNSTGSGTLIGMNVSVYHSAIDPDGINLAMGWDTNLDGIGDHSAIDPDQSQPHKASLCCTSQSRTGTPFRTPTTTLTW